MINFNTLQIATKQPCQSFCCNEQKANIHVPNKAETQNSSDKQQFKKVATVSVLTSLGAILLTLKALAKHKKAKRKIPKENST